MTNFKYPSPAQLYALEQMARRQRAEAQARLILGAAKWVGNTFKAIFTRPYARTTKGGMRHA